MPKLNQRAVGTQVGVGSRKRVPVAKRVVFETGPISVRFCHVLCTEGLPALCIDVRHANAALDITANKTDADGMAHLAEVGF